MKRLGLLTLVILASFGLVLSSSAPKTHAAAAFNQNRIIDDSIFDNTGKMSVQSINDFLNTFPNSCISPNSGFLATDPTGYSPNGGYTYGGNVTAGQVIYDASAAYGLNPQVMLATLQKEEGLVRGDGPYGCSTLAISAAVGYGCPDSQNLYDYSGVNLYTRNGQTATSISQICVNSAQKVGFSQQVVHAAWLFKFGEQRSKGNINWNVQLNNSPQPGDHWDNSDDPQSCYSGPMTQGNWQVCPSGSTTYYDGYRTIDGTAVHMDTGATASLYWYTPHFHGNQVFYDTFTGWFGPSQGVDYSWEYTGISISTGSSNVIGNTQVQIIVYAKNTGNQTWSNTNYPIRLATFLPTNHASILYDSSWTGVYRPATLDQSQVLPGNSGSFTFKANIPNRSGVYDENFNLVAEGAAWMPDQGFKLHLNITPSTYKWQMVSQSSNKGFVLTPGSTAQFTLVAKNTGNITWTNSGNPVRLATFIPTNRSSVFYDPSWVTSNRPAVLQESSVAPGQNGTFVFTVKAPNTPGFYPERFNLVMEGVSWFDDPWMEFDVNVGSFYKWQMVSQTSSTGTFTLPRNTSATYTLTARNTGNITWTNTGNPVLLATFIPTNRSSVFYDSSWIATNRPALLDSSTPSVAPGQTGKFIFTVKAPNTPGFYVERFNLVREGIAWFDDPWMEFDINVN